MIETILVLVLGAVLGIGFLALFLMILTHFQND